MHVRKFSEKGAFFQSEAEIWTWTSEILVHENLHYTDVYIGFHRSDPPTPRRTPTKFNMNWLHFTKLAISRLIMVRFEKFKIWHAQDSGADLSDVVMTSRDATRDMTWRARLKWRHYGSNHFLMSGCYGGLLWAYLIKLWEDFAHFRQANRYGQAEEVR